MPVMHVPPQRGFLPPIAISHPRALSPKRALAEFRLRARPSEPMTTANVPSVELELRRVGDRRVMDLGVFDHPRSDRRFAGPRPGHRYDLANIRFDPMVGSTLWLSHNVPDSSFYFKSLLQTLLAHAAAIGGSAVLHGGLIERNGRGFLLVGNSGSGKSSLCAFSLLCGARLVTDDMLVLAHDGQHFAGRGLRAYSLLRPATHGALPRRWRRLTRTVTTKEGSKHVLRLKHLGEQAIAHCAIDAIVLPEVSRVPSETGFTLAAAPKSAAVTRLYECLDGSALLPGLDVERAAVNKLLVALVRALPCFEVTTSPRLLERPKRRTRLLLDTLSRRLDENDTGGDAP